MPLQIPFDTAGLDPRTATAFDDLIAVLSKHFDDSTVTYTGAGSFFQPRCLYFLESAQSISNDTDTTIQWGTQGQAYDVANATGLSTLLYDNGALFSDRGLFLRAANTGKLIPPVAGQYLVIAHAQFAANATGRRQVWIEHVGLDGETWEYNRISVNAATAGASKAMTSHVITIRDPSETGSEDAIRVRVYQNSGGALDCGSGFGATSVQLIKLS